MGLTRKRDLRGGSAVWTRYPVPHVSGAPLRRSVRTEVLIVGAGISGAMLGQSLARAGLRPLILDRRREALLGSTAASTALLQFELDTPLIKLIAAVGRAKAQRVWLASRDAVNELRTRTHRLGITAQMKSRPSLYLAGNVLDAAGLRHELKARQRIGLASEYLDRASLRHHFGLDRAAALLSHGNAEANPVALAAGYLRDALAHGARLHAPHEIVALQRERSRTTLLTQDGREISARQVVFCTGYELAKIVPRSDTRIVSTWAIATRPQPKALWPQKALIWEASDPYLYLRSTVDGCVICGGEDAQFSSAEQRDALIGAKAKRIERKLRRLMPQLDARPKHAWAGSFGASGNGMPTIGSIPGYPRCFAVMGFGGNGITFSMLAAQLLTAQMLGTKPAASRLFAFR